MHVYFIGNNDANQFGPEISTKCLTERKSNESDIDIPKSIVLGKSHGLYLSNDQVFAVGKSEEGECGLYPNKQQYQQLQQVQLPKAINVPIKSIFSTHSSNHSFIQTIDHRIYAFGRNTDAQLGLAINDNGDISTQNQPTPTETFIPHREKLKYIECIQTANDYSIALSVDHKVYSTSYSSYGGNGHGTNWHSAQSLGSKAKDKMKQMVGKEAERFAWTKVTFTKRTIVQISLGLHHSLFRDDCGKILSCGLNRYGQLGVPKKEKDSKKDKPKDENEDTNEDSTHEKKKGWRPTFGKKDAKSKEEKSVEEPVQFVTKPTDIETLNAPVIDIAAGHYHSLCVSKNGDVYGFGNNDCGQSGQHTNLQQIPLPLKVEGLPPIAKVKAGSHHSAAMMKERSKTVEIYLFGSNSDGECMAGDVEHIYTPTPISDAVMKETGTQIKDIYLGVKCTCIITEDTEKQSVYSENKTLLQEKQHLQREFEQMTQEYNAVKRFNDQLSVESKQDKAAVNEMQFKEMLTRSSLVTLEHGWQEKYNQLKKEKETLHKQLIIKTENDDIMKALEMKAMDRFQNEPNLYPEASYRREQELAEQRQAFFERRDESMATQLRKKIKEWNQRKNEREFLNSEQERTEKTIMCIAKLETKIHEMIGSLTDAVLLKESQTLLTEYKQQSSTELDAQRNKLKKIEARKGLEQDYKQDANVNDEERMEKMRNQRKQQQEALKQLMILNGSYKLWKTSDLLHWIMGLENNLYEPYKDDVEKALKKESIGGLWIETNDIKDETLKGWGIPSQEHRSILFKHICCLKMTHLMKNKGIKEVQKKLDLSNVTKVLVISVGIAFYDDYPPLFTSDNDTDDVTTDMRYYRHVFGDEYGYTMITNDEFQYEMSDEQLHTFLVESRAKICSPHDQSQLFYEAVILTFGGHGNQYGIVCSNGKTLSWADIRAIFSDELLCKIPRIYLIDCCRSNDEEAQDSVSASNTVDSKSSNSLSTTVMLSEGKEVRGGLISRWITNAFRHNINENKIFGDICEIAKTNIKGVDSEQELTFTEHHRECENVIFKPNNRTRGKPTKNQNYEHTQF